MHQAGRVGDVEGLQHGVDDGQRLAGGHGAVGEPVAQGDALDVLHDEEHVALVPPEVVDRDDVGV